MTMTTGEVQILGVRRFGEDGLTPVVIDGKRVCGTVSDHIRNGCIGLEVTYPGRGGTGLFHLTSADALRLSDLLRAMASTNEEIHGYPA